MAIITPNKLAIPFPPLNPTYIGKTCPSTATRPRASIYSIDVLPANSLKNEVANQALRMSMNKTVKPIRFPRIAYSF